MDAQACMFSRFAGQSQPEWYVIFLPATCRIVAIQYAGGDSCQSWLTTSTFIPTSMPSQMSANEHCIMLKIKSLKLLLVWWSQFIQKNHQSFFKTLNNILAQMLFYRTLVTSCSPMQRYTNLSYYKSCHNCPSIIMVMKRNDNYFVTILITFRKRSAHSSEIVNIMCIS